MGAETRSNEDVLARWARLVIRHRGAVVLGWVVGLVAIVLVSRIAGGSFASSFTIPGTESQKATDLLKRRFPQQAGDSATIVLQATAGLRDPEIQGGVAALIERAKSLPGVVGVGSPYGQGGDGALSADGTVGYARV